MPVFVGCAADPVGDGLEDPEELAADELEDPGKLVADGPDDPEEPEFPWSSNMAVATTASENVDMVVATPAAEPPTAHRARPLFMAHDTNSLLCEAANDSL